MPRARQKQTENNQIAQKLKWHRSQIADLPSQDCVWRWGEVKDIIGQSILQWLAGQDLIVKEGDTGFWRVTARLVDYMRVTHDVVLNRMIGQHTLDIDVTEGIPRAVDTINTPGTRGRQVTLTGGLPRSTTTDTTDVPFRQTGRQDPSEHPWQDTLDDHLDVPPRGRPGS